MGFEVLNSALKKLAHWYEMEEIEEIAINQAGSVWLRMAGKRKKPWEIREDPGLTHDYLTDVLYLIANTYQLPFDPVLGSPLVFSDLPNGHRFSAVAGKNIMYDQNDLSGGVAISIRKHNQKLGINFSDYGLEKGLELKKIPKQELEIIQDPFEKLMAILKNGEHILVSGATATGKTTFLNNILQVIDKDVRVITVEDTRELIVPQKNHVHIVLSRTGQTNTFTYGNVIDLIVRMTPDVIIGGEISTENAGAIWELMGTGHDNCLASIHAESPEAAYKGFIDRITHTYPNIDREKLIKDMKEKLHVVQISREGNLRAVTEIV